MGAAAFAVAESKSMAGLPQAHWWIPTEGPSRLLGAATAQAHTAMGYGHALCSSYLLHCAVVMV